MRKRAPLLLVVAGAVAAFVLIRNSDSQGQDKPGGPAVSSTQSGRPARGPAAKPGPAGADDDEPAAAPPKEPNGRKVFSAKWGAGDDDLGHERPEEGAPTGPMSVATDAKGRVVVLDGVNGRLVRRSADGKTESTVKVGLLDPQDMAIGPDGSAAVLDRYADKKVAVYDDTGSLVGELPLEGEGVEDVGSVTGVFVDGKDVYVEREHGPLVQIGTTGGLPADPRVEIPGRPSRDGLSFLKAGIIEAPEGRVYVASIDRATMQNRFTRELRLPAFVRAIKLLDTDKTGTIYFATEVEQADGKEVVLLQCLEPLKGVVVGNAVLPVNTLPEESFRDFAVLDEGGVIYSLRTEQGVDYIRYDCE